MPFGLYLHGNRFQEVLATLVLAVVRSYSTQDQHPSAVAEQRQVGDGHAALPTILQFGILVFTM
jgi:hypothetical protein